MAIVSIFLFFLLTMVSFAQFQKGTVDTVLSVSFGSNTSFGQSNEYFPNNIFGIPDSASRKDIPSSSESQICALGLNGSITIGFKGKMIRDMPGKDFTVFENAFEFLGDRVFIEPAVVEVSNDGVNFIPFPFDSLTLQGCAGITPTIGNEDPFTPELSGGNSFDLADIGIDSVIVIRITDVSAIILKENHPLYSPIVNGFDLDAVVTRHLQNNSIITSTEEHTFPNPKLITSSLSVSPKDGETIIIYDYSGKQVLLLKEGSLDFSLKGTFLKVTYTKNTIIRNVIHIY